MKRVHPTCTERQSLNKECGWKGGDRSGLAQGQELTGRKRRTKTSLQERKTYLTLTGLLMEGLAPNSPKWHQNQRREIAHVGYIGDLLSIRFDNHVFRVARWPVSASAFCGLAKSAATSPHAAAKDNHNPGMARFPVR